jgi:pimeloyl-ACP methyl ester carboxylesterase
VIRRLLLAAGAVVLPIASVDVLARRASRRLLAGPRTTPDEAGLGPALDDLGGEVVRIRARDGLRLSARWLAAETEAGDRPWTPDPHEAIVLLHGWSGSIVPHLVEYGPFLRRTAGVLGLDFRGHGDSDEAPTTFGLREVDDIAGALAWLGERGVERVALVGMSIGGISAIAAVAVLGDGSLVGTDADPARPMHVPPPRRPRILAVVGDSVAPELVSVAVPLIPGPRPRFVAGRLFDAVTRTLGADPRDTEPIRLIGLLEGVDVLLISGADDPIVPVAEARRLAEAGPPGTEVWIVPGADHRGSHRVDPSGYEARVTGHLRRAFGRGREHDPIIAGPVRVPADPGELLED